MLWITTQNKKSLMNVKEVTVKGKYIEGVISRSFFTEWNKLLGKYESNERAEAILQEIHQVIKEGKGSPVAFTMPEK